MTKWLEDPTVWIFVAAVIAQAAVSQWRVGQHEAWMRRQEARESKQDIVIDSMREWRAQAREQMRNLADDIKDLTARLSGR